MIAATHTIDSRSPEANMTPTASPDDPRLAAFCSEARSEVFHAVAYPNDIWKEDPFDVESIHQDARATFQRLVGRASGGSGPSSGRVLLLLGESGSGKTHLMRAFRNWAHAPGQGYFGYMQMTSTTSHYGRYVLNNLIDALNLPYFESLGESSGLMRLSNALVESVRGLSIDRLSSIREDDLDPACRDKLIDALLNQIVIDGRFDSIDTDLIRALLLLQGRDPLLKGPVLKYLRCERLSERDRGLLGGTEPRDYDDAPDRLIVLFGRLMAIVESVPVILCVDQLEDLYDHEDALARFRRAMTTLCSLAGKIPNSVVVVSCLENLYETLKGGLARSIIDRLEIDPPPLTLKSPRGEEEIVALVGRRLRFLYEEEEVPFQEDDPTYPFPKAFLKTLIGMRTRDVLERCRAFRERCAAAGRIVPHALDQPSAVTTPIGAVETTDLERAWNDARAEFSGEVPVAEGPLAALLTGAIEACAREHEPGRRFAPVRDGRLVSVACHSPEDRLLIGVCNAKAQGGGLGKQVAEVESRAGGTAPVLVRSTEFPDNPKTAISKQIGTLLAKGGRKVVVEDSDWRAMSAFPRFRETHQDNPAFAGWLQEAKPLSRLRALRAILDLDGASPPRPVRVEPEPTQTPPPPNPLDPEPSQPGAEPAPRTGPAGPIVLGTSHDRARLSVTIEPDELTRHAAFLGGAGSGKTTLALNLVEQLLVRAIPAILIDRKGDLACYARAESWTRPVPEAAAAWRASLRERIDVALYTPGDPRGRPLSIAVAPPGLGRLGSFDRTQVARYSASALAGMMNYGAKGTDRARVAILTHAIDLLAQLAPDDPVGLPALIDFIAENDPTLVNAVGRLDTKNFAKLVQDLETLRLSRGDLLAAQGEPLEIEALLGLGRHAATGKTRLSIISTKFLGTNQDIQFWVTQLLVELARWSSRSPMSRLQAVVLFDEADLYLPATRQPPTKEPMENLLKRARAAGLGILLATQSPGDLDYKGRDNVRAWFVGRVKEPTALAKMRPMLSECRTDVESKLPTQEPGRFHLLRDGDVTSLLADRSVIAPEQLSEDEILALAKRTRLGRCPGDVPGGA